VRQRAMLRSLASVDDGRTACSAMLSSRLPAPA
jgi:hypothetical protein